MKAVEHKNTVFYIPTVVNRLKISPCQKRSEPKEERDRQENKDPGTTAILGKDKWVYQDEQHRAFSHVGSLEEGSTAGLEGNQDGELDSTTNTADPDEEIKDDGALRE